MKPVPKLQTATRFTKISHIPFFFLFIQYSCFFHTEVRGSPPNNPYIICDDLLAPSSHGDKGAIEMTWEQEPCDILLEPEITFDCVCRSLSRLKA
jgi:hypothetical protein